MFCCKNSRILCFTEVVLICLCSPTTALSNGPSGVTSQSTNVMHDNQSSVGGGGNQPNATGSLNKLEKPPLLSSSIDSIKKSYASGTKVIQQQQMLELTDNAASIPPAPSSGSYISSSDPVVLPSQDLPLPSAVGSQHVPIELTDDKPMEKKSASVKLCMYANCICLYIFSNNGFFHQYQRKHLIYFPFGTL